MGKDAPLGDDLLKAFPAGNLSNFAHRDLPGIREALGVNTIGDLANYTRSEIVGPQCRYAGNKTISWIEMVLKEFKMCLTVPMSKAERDYISQHGLDKF